MTERKINPLSLPRQEAYIEAALELKELKNLPKIVPILKKYNLKYVSFDFKLQITVRGLASKVVPKSVAAEAIDEFMDIPGLNQIKPILYKYNITHICVNDSLDIIAKRKKLFCPSNYVS